MAEAKIPQFKLSADVLAGLDAAFERLVESGHLIGIWTDIVTEIHTAREKHGKQSELPYGTGPHVPILGNADVARDGAFHLEEAEAGILAGVFKRATDLAFGLDDGTRADILLEEVFEAMAEEDPEALRAELVQVAAMATAWVLDIDEKRAAQT